MVERTVGVGQIIIEKAYSSYHELVYYAGMPSKDVFSLIYETFYMKENPERSATSKARDNIIRDIQEHRQLYYPVDIKEVNFPSRSQIKFIIKGVGPTSLTAIIKGYY